jgi:uncharacterized protein
MNELKIVSHRPYPLPKLPWLMTQTWTDVVFAHWPVAASSLRSIVPEGLEIDMYSGQAWISIVFFSMKDAGLIFTPRFSLKEKVHEMNVRTYVKRNGKQGVYFFSLDTNSLLNTAGPRLSYFLPYFWADLKKERKNESLTIQAARKSSHREYKCRLSISGQTFSAEKGTLDEWLTERYCLFNRKGGRYLRTDIHHKKWKLLQAEGRTAETAFIPPELKGTAAETPIFHYSKSQTAYIWPWMLD